MWWSQQLCTAEIEAKGVGCNLNDLDCTCGAGFRSQRAACESITCDISDLQRKWEISQD